MEISKAVKIQTGTPSLPVKEEPMETIISFTFNDGRGHMTIVLDEFFPTDATRLRKLLKTIDEDYEHRDELRAIIVQHCGQRASALLDGRRDLANKAIEQHTRATEMQPDIDKLTDQIKRLTEYCKAKEGRAYRGQLKELKAKLKDMKQRQRDALASYRDCQRKFVSAGNRANRLKKNAEVADYDE
jgi:hypothetical protein